MSTRTRVLIGSLLVIGCFVAALIFTGPDIIKSQTEQRLSDTLGRPVDIGSVEIDLSLSPELILKVVTRDLKFGASPHSKHKYTFHAETLSLTAAPAELLASPPHLRSLSLQRFTAQAEKAVGSPTVVQADTPQPHLSSSSSVAGASEIPVIIDHFELSDGQLIHRDPETSTTDVLELTLTGSLNPHKQAVSGEGQIELNGVTDIDALNDWTATDLGSQFPAISQFFQHQQLITQGFSAPFDGSLVMTHGDQPQLVLALHSDRIDLRPLTPNPADAIEDQPEQSEGHATSEQLIPDIALDLSPLEAVHATVDLEIDQLIRHVDTLHDVGLKLVVDNGGVDLSEARFSDTDGGTIRVTGYLRPQGDSNKVEITVQGKEVNIGYPATTPQEASALPRLTIDVLLFGSGHSTRELAATAGGYIQVTSGKGVISGAPHGLLTNDFLAELLNALNPFQKNDPETRVNCSAISAHLDNGTVRGNPIFVLSSKKFDIFANARVNLANEKLFATFKTVPMKGLGVSASAAFNPFIGVGGTLARPALTLDPKGTVIQGSLAFFSGGLSLIGMNIWDRFIDTRNPCDLAIREGQEDKDRILQRYQASGSPNTP